MVRREDDVGADGGRIQYSITWLWIDKHRREMLSWPKLTKNCSTKRKRSLQECVN